MPSLKSNVLLLIAGLLIVNTVSAESTSNTWLTDYEAAMKTARETQKPVLLHFHAIWCGPCRSMEQQVLHTPEIKQLLGENVIGVKIDSDKNPAIIKRFGIGALPSDLVIDPSGKVLYRGSGFKSKNSYLRVVTTSADKFVPKQLEMTVAPTEPTVEEDQPVLLGLDGFSPVVLLKERRWVEGNETFLAEHKGMIYHLQTAEEKQVFESAPERYTPQLLECDPVEMYFADKAVRGSTQYGAYFDGKLFLFQNHDNRETFKKSPLKFTATRHVFKTSDIVLQ
ncbi:MAG: thioredoxin family protein [Planctomycetaceae bacterium]|jgi:thiol-disulfide isomerase/thioredoxin|nr:thioredoxin family protein [Planctomycetaceae bacterium]